MHFCCSSSEFKNSQASSCTCYRLNHQPVSSINLFPFRSYIFSSLYRMNGDSLPFHFIKFPPGEGDSYTFRQFIAFFDAFSILTKWPNEEKIQRLQFYLHGEILKAYSFTNHHYSMPHDDERFTFDLLIMHINMIMHQREYLWFNLLDRCSCSYCHHRPANSAIQLFSCEPSFTRMLSRTSRHPPIRVEVITPPPPFELMTLNYNNSSSSEESSSPPPLEPNIPNSRQSGH